MNEEWELTEEHFQIAEKNGIPRKNVLQRFNKYYWDIERAITQPMRSHPDWDKWREIAHANGIDGILFRKRVKIGWSEERAATETRETGASRRKKESEELRKELSPYWEQAEANGISFQVFRKRLAKGMSLEEAANRPKRWRGEWKA